MITLRSLLLAFATALAAIALPGAAADTNQTAALVAGNNAFACDLYARLKTTDGNLFFSPYSIATCLGMTYTGARGDTAMQMARTLHFDASPDELPATFAALQSTLTLTPGTNGVELALANALWSQEGHPFLPGFLSLAQTDFQASLNQADFRTQAEPARHEINHWVSRQTRGKIANLLPSGVLSPATRLVLVNAIYFKGLWATPFKTAETKPAPFATGIASKVTAPLMHATARFSYLETDNFQLLELPYQASAGSSNSVAAPTLIVILPTDVNGLPQLEKILAPAVIDNWLASAHSAKVSVFLPKFKLTSQFSLAPTLTQMGMPLAFTAQADFSGIDGARDLLISAVVHKAYVDINEQGTEAAAATGTVMSLTSVARPQPVPVFRADHPFLFLIRDANGSLLFLGRETNPTK